MGYSVLLVEDDLAGRELAAFELRRAGFDVDAVGDGEAGLESFIAEHHRVVVTDLRMPRMGGLELMEAILADSPETPVLIITACDCTDVRRAACAYRAFAVVGKPFRCSDLIELVRQAAESRGRDSGNQ